LPAVMEAALAGRSNYKDPLLTARAARRGLGRNLIVHFTVSNCLLQVAR
jgi:hypothetical protein